MAAEEENVDPRKVFDLLDMDKQGYITLKYLMNSTTFSGFSDFQREEILRKLNMDNTTRLDFPQFVERWQQGVDEGRKENIGSADNKTPSTKKSMSNSKGVTEKRTPLARSNMKNIGATDNRAATTGARAKTASRRNDRNDEVFVGSGQDATASPRLRGASAYVASPTAVASRSYIERKSSGYESDSNHGNEELREGIDEINRKIDGLDLNINTLRRAFLQQCSVEIQEKIDKLERENKEQSTKLANERAASRKLTEKRRANEVEIESLKREKLELNKEIEELRRKLNNQLIKNRNAQDPKEMRKLTSKIAKLRKHDEELKIQLTRIGLEFGAKKPAKAGNEHKNLSSESSPDESPKAAADGGAASIKAQKSGEEEEEDVQDVEVGLEALTLNQIHELKQELKKYKIELKAADERIKAYAEYCKNIEHELNEK